ncbi:PTS system cellobiose-specific IIC component [Enterococcus sp. PF1-24]|uniref:PTS sugar transporter subunit IIC n=1 Tax=unclassified Enterococcus TaxID=2608891 RepID=UPI0024772D68|nr:MULTISPECIES: PTS transporter subunit EIIC [unclassified Enterococcus]MDH6364325.1 PTS system cellobiose-specific IIC component [Enterococcus sp. PFB1-1]MDH6401486.1 PTS system cellobiose-specific IIC component [Enterococcus sp. PF1-24]
MSFSSISQKVAPRLNKAVTAFSNNVVVKTIAAGMARLLPVTIVGSILTLIGSLPIDAYTKFLDDTGLAPFINLGNTMTNGIITIYLVAALASEMARFYKKNQMNAILISLLAFFIVTPLTVFEVGDSSVSAFTLSYLGSRGMFVGMIVALVATRLYVLMIDKGIKIKMPSAVPPVISSSFESLISFILIAVLFIGVNFVFAKTSYGDIHSCIYTVLQKPLEGASGSLATMLLICFIGEVFWWFGIHGSNVTSAITATLYMPLAIANTQALASGEPLPFILNSYFLNIYKGPRHLALACLLLFFVHSKQLKAIGQVSFVPGAFGISEPMKFGIPMVFQPLIFLPMSLAPVICIAIAYFATTIGFLPRVAVDLPWSMPPFISGFIAGGFAGVVVQIIQFIAVILIYIPFLKVLDKQKIAEEDLREKELQATA